MTPLDALTEARDLAFRMLPHRCPTGVVTIGRPTRSSPVVATGNYALTVRRIRRALAGRDVWLLVVNSRGINVWCAAGGGHLTHHDFVAAIRASRLDDLVDHRRLIVPQLTATGVERRYITDATGWNVRWGPADMADLHVYLDRGCRVHESVACRSRCGGGSRWRRPG
jgi:CO dehydrogenase/acetyl-CoA synthase gamma subunit (corrinoid Fe-S protein)